MTRKHFQLIADVIRQQHFNSQLERRSFAENMAAALSSTNSNFDRSRFLDACGVV